MLLQQVLKISSTELILESSKWQLWAWEYFQAHYHSLLNLLASPRMTGHTLHQPSHQIEAMIRGLTDAAQSLGSHPVYSHCWDSEQSEHSNYPLCSHSLLWKQENRQLREMLPPTDHLLTLCTQQLQIHKAVCEIQTMRSKVKWNLVYTPFLFCCRKWICAESLYKLCTAQMTCLEGAFFQYMVMRDVQLTGLYQEDAHNKGGGGEKERQYDAKAYTELYMLHRHGQVKK